ncbi:MAG: peptide ABC transporter substrate-binding protein [Myxococcota bacterium]
MTKRGLKLWAGLTLCAAVVGGMQLRQGHNVSQPQRLRMGLGAQPQHLDPAKCRLRSCYTLNLNLCEPLVAFDQKTLAVIPAAAQRWQVSADGRTYTFYLRPQARWWLGKAQPTAAVTAHDFVYAWRRLLNTKAHLPSSDLLLQMGVAHANDIEALNAHTLQIRVQTRAHGQRLLRLAASPALCPLYEPAVAQAAARWAWSTQRPINGPYMLQQHVVQSHFLLKKNPVYWNQAQVAIEEALLYVRGTQASRWQALLTKTPAARLTCLASAVKQLSLRSVWHQGLRETLFSPATLGCYAAMDWAFTDNPVHLLNRYQSSAAQQQIDWLGPHTSVPNYVLQQWKHTTDYRLNRRAATYHYWFQTQKPPLDNPQVRQALCHSIDRQAVVQQAAAGMAQPLHGFFPNFPGSYRALSAQEGIAFNPRKARALLAQAGFAHGAGFPTLTLSYNQGYEHAAVAKAVARMWRNHLGIDVQLAGKPSPLFFKQRHQGQFDIARGGWMQTLTKQPDTFALLYTKQSAFNDSQWADPSGQLDALTQQALATANPSQAQRLYRQIESILLQHLPACPIYTPHKPDLVKPHVQGYFANAANYHPIAQLRLSN